MEVLFILKELKWHITMYNYQATNYTKEQQREVNDKLLFLIQTGQWSQYVGLEDIYNNFKGLGGLHDLSQSDFSSYWAYSEAKKEFEQGEFFTPHSLCQQIADNCQLSDKQYIADLTSGIGNFFNFCPDLSKCYSNELSVNNTQIQKLLYPQLNITTGDIRVWQAPCKFDIIFGNPPFNFNFENMDSQRYYIHLAHKHLNNYGLLAIITPYSYLMDDYKYSNIRKDIDSQYNFLGQTDVSKYFSVGIKVKVMYFVKTPSPKLPYKNEFSNSEQIKQAILASRHEAKYHIASSYKLDNIDNQAEYKIRLYMYQLERNPKTRQYVGKCLDYIEKFNTQTQGNLSWEDYRQRMITPNKILSYIKHYLAKQHEKPKSKGLIKQDYGLRLGKQFYQFGDYDYPVEDKKYLRLWNKKRQFIVNQTTPFSLISPASYSNYLPNIEFTGIQHTDIGKLMNKKYALLQWSMGSGKTLASLTVALNRGKQTFIVAPAMAIKNNWVNVLNEFSIDYTLCQSKYDIISNKPFVLMTCNFVVKHYKSIKLQVRKLSYKSMLILDESDCIANLSSKQSKAIVAAFRRLQYKLLLSGTATRNNINELFPQLDLLYNGSQAFISNAPVLWIRKRGDENLTTENNDYQGKSYPAYSKGLNLFKQSFNPEKQTVFGQSKNTQDIYNASYLREILNYTIINRSYEEVTGNSYKVSQVQVNMNPDEIKLYSQILHNFMSMKHLFTSTGDARKDRVLEILQQLNLMLKACVIPNSIDSERTGIDNQVDNSKLNELIRQVNQVEGQVAIGLRHIQAVMIYAKALEVTGRKVFVITGDSVSIANRQAVVNKAKLTPNSILISTQQALSCSVNIGHIDHIFIPELAWNLASMSQFYFRFIRFTSKGCKNVVFITYANSIESNLLSLLLNKERLNNFTKDRDDDLMANYGIEFDLFSQLLTKIKVDDEIRIKWNQEIEG